LVDLFAKHSDIDELIQVIQTRKFSKKMLAFITQEDEGVFYFMTRDRRYTTCFKCIPTDDMIGKSLLRWNHSVFAHCVKILCKRIVMLTKNPIHIPDLDPLWSSAFDKYFKDSGRTGTGTIHGDTDLRRADAFLHRALTHAALAIVDYHSKGWEPEITDVAMQKLIQLAKWEGLNMKPSENPDNVVSEDSSPPERLQDFIKQQVLWVERNAKKHGYSGHQAAVVSPERVW